MSDFCAADALQLNELQAIVRPSRCLPDEQYVRVVGGEVHRVCSDSSDFWLHRFHDLVQAAAY